MRQKNHWTCLLLGLFAIVLVTVVASFAAEVTEPEKQQQPARYKETQSPYDATPSGTMNQCVRIDVLIACVEFDAKGKLRVEKKDAEPEVNLVGTLGLSLASKCNEEKANLPPNTSPATAGAVMLFDGLAEGEQLRSLQRFQLLARLDGSETLVQKGSSKGRITGSSQSPRGVTNSISMENVGTLVSGSAQPTPTGKIALSLSVESSGLAPKEEGLLVAVTGEKTIRTPATDTLTVKSEIIVADGETVVLGDFVETHETGVRETFILVAPTLIKR